jgi:prevent-host-death family protein
MKQLIDHLPPARRLSVAEAKSHLSAVLLEQTPTIIHKRGRDIAVLVPVAEYQRLTAHEVPSASARFLARVEELKAELGGGVEDFAPERATLETRIPGFGRKAGR